MVDNKAGRTTGKRRARRAETQADGGRATHEKKENHLCVGVRFCNEKGRVISISDAYAVCQRPAAGPCAAVCVCRGFVSTCVCTSVSTGGGSRGRHTTQQQASPSLGPKCQYSPFTQTIKLGKPTQRGGGQSQRLKGYFMWHFLFIRAMEARDVRKDCRTEEL